MQVKNSSIGLTVLFAFQFCVLAQSPRGPRRDNPWPGVHAITVTPNQSDAPSGFEVARVGIQRGKVTPLEYESKSTGGIFRAMVYTPPGYTATRKYPVLYLLHGASGDENNWIQAIHADAILDNLYAEKKLIPMIVVMPSSLSVTARQQAGDSREAKAQASSTFGEILLGDLIPFIESKYPVLTGRESRALAGLSMGAGVALATGLANSDQFAWVGAFSGAGRRLSFPKEKFRLLWLSVGNQDSLMGSGMLTANTFLTEKKIPHVFRINGGGHEPKVWMNDLYYFAPLLFQP